MSTIQETVEDRALREVLATATGSPVAPGAVRATDVLDDDGHTATGIAEVDGRTARAARGAIDAGTAGELVELDPDGLEQDPFAGPWLWVEFTIERG